MQELPSSHLKDLRIVIAGAGTAGTGVANILLQYKMRLGKNKEEACQDFFILD